jgi:hypothetical protein
VFKPGEDEFRPASTQSSRIGNNKNSALKAHQLDGTLLESLDSNEMAHQ